MLDSDGRIHCVLYRTERVRGNRVRTSRRDKFQIAVGNLATLCCVSWLGFKNRLGLDEVLLIALVSALVFNGTYLIGVRLRNARARRP